MMKRHLAGLVVAALVAGGGVAAAAAPGDSPPNRPPREGRPGGPAGQRGPGGPAMKRAIHGDLVVKAADGFENVTFDRGVVEAKGDDSLTLKREDGKTVTLKVSDDTTYRGVDGFEGIQIGKPAVVVSAGGTARNVGQRARGGNKPNRSNVRPDEEQVPAT